MSFFVLGSTTDLPIQDPLSDAALCDMVPQASSHLRGSGDPCCHRPRTWKVPFQRAEELPRRHEEIRDIVLGFEVRVVSVGLAVCI